MARATVEHGQQQPGHMGRAFGLETIAEYVEDRATIDYLTKTGIDYAQGYAVGREHALHG